MKLTNCSRCGGEGEIPAGVAPDAGDYYGNREYHETCLRCNGTGRRLRDLPSNIYWTVKARWRIRQGIWVEENDIPF